jgi:hypothetical protein
VKIPLIGGALKRSSLQLYRIRHLPCNWRVPKAVIAPPFKDSMVKFTLAVAAMLVASVAGTRVQAQSEQFASVDQTPIVQDAPAPAAVDQTPIVQDAPTPATLDMPAQTGPSMEASALSPRFSSDAALTANTMRRPTHGAGVGLMIFGGAALITGLVVGGGAGTVIAVGGALVGLYGLYVYLGRPTGMEQGSRIGLGYKLNTN